MDTTDPHPAPADWLTIIEESEADLAAGRIVPGEAVMRDLAEALLRMEAKARPKSRGEAPARP